MRIAGKIFSITFTILFVLSLALNIILGVSSTYKLGFKDNLDERIKLYYSGYYYLDNIKEFTSTVYDTQNKTLDESSCYLDEEKIGESKWVCSQISYKYDHNNNLVRTSYFPGDGFKYSLEGQISSKSVYSNEDLVSFALLVPMRIKYILNHLVLSLSDLPEGSSMEFDTDIDFDINKFTASKTIKLNCEAQGSKLEADYTFDSKDRVTSAYSSQYQNSITINYKKTDLHMPDLTSF